MTEYALEYISAQTGTGLLSMEKFSKSFKWFRSLRLIVSKQFQCVYEDKDAQA